MSLNHSRNIGVDSENFPQRIWGWEMIDSANGTKWSAAISMIKDDHGT